MRGFISTSRTPTIPRTASLVTFVIFAMSLALLPSPRAYAADEKKDPKTNQPEEEDFTGTPYTEYGEFNEEGDEEEDSKFFKFGRLFGVSLGLGFEGVDGYKGVLYEGGFPVVDAKIHYWFDFHFALDLDIAWAQHAYNDVGTTQGGRISVNIIRFGLDAKYYFDTHNLAAPLSFASPYLIVGFGAFSKSESSAKRDENVNDTAVGFSPGVGLEFAIKPRKVFLALEGKYNVVNFPKDSGTDRFFNSTPKLDDFTGNFFTVIASFLITW